MPFVKVLFFSTSLVLLCFFNKQTNKQTEKKLQIDWKTHVRVRGDQYNVHIIGSYTKS